MSTPAIPPTDAESQEDRGWRLIVSATLVVTIFALSAMLAVIGSGWNAWAAWNWRGGNCGYSVELAAHNDVQEMKMPLLFYLAANGFYPSTEHGLGALITPPASEPQPDGWRQLLDKPRLDPWKQEYFYENPGQQNSTGYDLFSAGPDRTPHTADDIGNWPQK